ncbi:dioxygenase family protein [Gloeophyllum trabeum ATCC 11539]|uniref:Dioxygenase family protein n=1 Tax=Gloeophyllum trabeum (strain ATCC 11539 / FP-39264 / Madison 617) TaxID=670483 RepID=S7RD10_GLOTA|nr:dioxygenase family protein [Gloeophyllum trabeum ATCC 11539]EPQ52090.1 dioxygenase family protein [Gloeophyllum trabeum ATCC 11539]
MADDKKPLQAKAVSNGLPPPNLDLPYPDRPELITENLLKLTNLITDERKKYIFKNLITHIHQFINETSITTDEWMNTIQFLTRTGQICTPIRQEFILLSDVLGISALVDALNNPPVSGGTESSVLGPFFTEDAPDVNNGDSIASEGKGQYMYVEGRVIDTHGKPVPNALIETWETDEYGFYDTQYADRSKPDCRGRLRTDKDGRYGYRAVVPVAYPIPGDGPVGDLLLMLNRHNMRPNHLHMMIEAPGYQKLTTAFYPEGDEWLASDAVFGVKKSLVVTLKDVDNEQEARKRGFPKGSHFKLLEHDLVLVPEAESKAAREQYAREHAVNRSNEIQA